MCSLIIIFCQRSNKDWVVYRGEWNKNVKPGSTPTQFCDSFSARYTAKLFMKCPIQRLLVLGGFYEIPFKVFPLIKTVIFPRR